MRFRIGLVVATMALALVGQWLALIIVAPHDSPVHSHGGSPAHSARPWAPRPGGAQGAGTHGEQRRGVGR